MLDAVTGSWRWVAGYPPIASGSLDANHPRTPAVGRSRRGRVVVGRDRRAWPVRGVVDRSRCTGPSGPVADPESDPRRVSLERPHAENLTSCFGDCLDVCLAAPDEGAGTGEGIEVGRGIAHPVHESGEE
jgi:hypothetical protein